MPSSVSHAKWTDRVYVEHARIYQHVLEPGLKTAPAEADGIAKLLRKHGTGRGMILYVACGIGRHSLCLARQGHDVVGLDFSSVFLRRGRQLARELGVEQKTKLIQGEFSKIKSALPSDQHFDAILLPNLLRNVTGCPSVVFETGAFAATRTVGIALPLLVQGLPGRLRPRIGHHIPVHHSEPRLRR